MSIISNEYLDRFVNDLRQEQKLVLQHGATDRDEDNKYIQLLSNLIAGALKIKTYREPKEDKPEKSQTKRK